MTNEANLGPSLSARLTYLLKRALLELEDLHAESLGPTGVAGRELPVLLLLDAHEPESQHEVARRLNVDRTTMVGLLDALEAKGFVARRADIADRRRNVVELTSSGQQALQHATTASDEAERLLLDELDGDDARQLRTLLGRIGHRRGHS